VLPSLHCAVAKYPPQSKSIVSVVVQESDGALLSKVLGFEMKSYYVIESPPPIVPAAIIPYSLPLSRATNDQGLKDIESTVVQ